MIQLADRVVLAFRPAFKSFNFCHHERALAREGSAFSTSSAAPSVMSNSLVHSLKGHGFSRAVPAPRIFPAGFSPRPTRGRCS